MHRCAVHKLTNWHIRLLSNTKTIVCGNYLAYKYENRVQMHLCKTIINNYIINVYNCNSDVTGK